MKYFLSTTVKLARIAIGLSFCVLMAAVVIQVLGRTVFSDSPVWTEELTRYALLFLTAFGAGLSYRIGDMVNVDIIDSFVSEKWQIILKIVSATAVSFLCLMLLIPAWKFTAIGAIQTSPALGWRKDFIHISIFILIVLMLLFAILRIIKLCSEKTDSGKPLEAQK